MSRPSLLIALSLVLAPGLLFADDTTVYKSKNADGTNVYTQIETRGAETRQVDGRDPKTTAPAEAAKPKSDQDVACERARANLAVLDSGKAVETDKDGDGTNEVLTPEEIAKERDVANSLAAAYCTAPPKT